MGVLFEKQPDGKYKDWDNNCILDALTVNDKISDIIVTHSRIFVLLYDCIIYLSDHASKEVKDKLEAAIQLPKKFDKDAFLRELGKNIQECMQHKEYPYKTFWQQINYYNDWCTTGENWNIIQKTLRLSSLGKVLHILMVGIGIEKKEDYNAFASDLLKMNELRNRVAHGDISVRLAVESFNKSLFIEPTQNNTYTDVNLIYERYMELAEEWKAVLGAEPEYIIQELGGVFYG